VAGAAPESPRCRFPCEVALPPSARERTTLSRIDYTDAFLLAHRRRSIGMEAEMLFKREPGVLLVATIMKLNNPLARAVWTVFSPQHRCSRRTP
jgi:hypothetical protein